MTRLQKKCLIASAGFHGALIVTLLATAAFRSKPDDTELSILTIIPSRILDRVGVGGGETIAVATPALQPVQPAPPPVAPPETHAAEPAPVDPTPPVASSHVRDTIVTRPPLRPRDPPKTVKTDPVKPADKPTRNDKPAATSTARRNTITPTYEPVVRGTRNGKPTETAAISAAQAAGQRRRSEAAAALSGLATAIRDSGAKATVVDLPGQGGGEAFIGYKNFVFNAYYHAWKTPEQTVDKLAVTDAKIVVNRDGTIISSEIVNKSGDTAMDRSVDRALDLVKSLPPFPEKTLDAQRTFIIRFNLEGKRIIRMKTSIRRNFVRSLIEFWQTPRFFVVAAVLLCAPLVLPAQDQINIKKPATKLIPISVSGFSGEIDSVVKFDLSVMGMELTTPDKADYVISGTENGRLEGRVSQGASVLLSRAYTSGNPRSQAHAFADDIVDAILHTPRIFQSRIAFCRNESGDTEIAVSDFDGNEVHNLTHDKSLVATPAWIPSGGKLFYTSWLNGNTEIFEHNLTSGARKVFAAFGGGNFNPVISPDGTKVAMILGKSGSPNLYVSDINGENIRALTTGKEDVSSPTWSPNGREICFVQRSGHALLRKVSVAGGAPVAVRAAGAAANLTSPDWSPDGKTIIFTMGSGSFSLGTVPAAGGDAEILVAGEDPCWAPNSRTVIFTRRINNKKILSLLDVPTKHVKDVRQISGSCSQPAWAR